MQADIAGKGEFTARGCPQPQQLRHGVGVGAFGHYCVIGIAAVGDSRAPGTISQNALAA